MPAPDVVLYADQTSPATAISWLAADGQPLDLSTGYTFAVRLVDDTGVVRATVSSGITGAATAPNVLVPWDGVDLSAVSGLLRLVLTATDGAGLVRYFRPDSPPTVLVRPVPAAAE